MTQWTDDQLAKAKALWIEGRSGGEIVKELARLGLKVSRNAVLGVVYRGGLMRGGSATRPPDVSAKMVKAVKREDQVAARQKREAAKKAEKAKLIETTRPVPIASDYEEAELNARSIAPLCNDAGAPVAPHLTALKVNQCKWPIGDTREAGFAFCARAIGKGHDVGVSYCPEHRRLAYVPPLKSLEAYISNTTWHADRAA